jgi:hypothetical protein
VAGCIGGLTLLFLILWFVVGIAEGDALSKLNLLPG